MGIFSFSLKSLLEALELGLGVVLQDPDAALWNDSTHNDNAA